MNTDSKTARLLILICSGFLLLTVLKSYYFSIKSGGGDLRSRIVASRMLFTDKSPYFYKWQPGDSDYFLDPNNHFDWPVNTNISSPAELLLIYPISLLPYRFIRFAWTTLELLAVFSILFLLFRNLKNPSLLLFSLIAVGIVSSDIWMFHSERGQKYIFYALFLAIIYAISKRESKGSLLFSGILSGLFIYIRPFMGVLGFSFLIGKRWNMLTGWLIGVIAGFLVFGLPFHHLWKEYFASMELWLQMLRGGDVLIKNPLVYEIPHTVEGLANINVYTGFNIEILRPIPDYLDMLGIYMPSGGSALLFCSVSLILGLIFLKKNRNPDLEALFIFGFFLYLFADLCFSVPRNGYSLVQWLFAMPVLVNRFRKNTRVLVLLFTGMLMFHNFPFFFPQQAALGEVVFLYFTLIMILKPAISSSMIYK